MKHINIERLHKNIIRAIGNKVFNIRREAVPSHTKNYKTGVVGARVFMRIEVRKW